jgi:two-component system sensor histidine kinase KdpD
MDARVLAAGRIAASVLAVGAVTAGCAAFVQVNPTTVALIYVVVILLIATTWGIAESTAASLVAMVCFNFFFLPPVGTLTIADPQNWVALVAFLLTATIASQLSVRARRRTSEALARQSDLERLYALSRALLLSEGGASLPGTIARHIADAFALQAVGVYDQRRDKVAWAGAAEFPGSDNKLREVARRSVAIQERSLTAIAIQLGGQSVGSVGIVGGTLSDTVLHSIANLAAIGLERARGEEATARAEAARHSSELRATVLDALAHELKTPLTSMKAASNELRSSPTIGARDRELAAILDEEFNRFQSLVSDAVTMLRIDAGDFAVHRDRHDLTAIIDATVRGFERRLDGHQLVRQLPAGMTVDADRELLALALRQLVDNALKYSPPSSTIEIEAHTNDAVEITVRNSGSTIPESERPRIVERFFRGARARNIPGTGMGLTIVKQIAHAHGGTLAIGSSTDAGTAFTLSLPRGESKP